MSKYISVYDDVLNVCYIWNISPSQNKNAQETNRQNFPLRVQLSKPSTLWFSRAAFSKIVH